MAEVKMKLPEGYEAKPLSPTLQKIVDWIGTLTGASDPTNIMPQPMVTAFPGDKALRVMKSTINQKKIMDMLIGSGLSSERLPAVMKTISKYPRVLAHIGEAGTLENSERMGLGTTIGGLNQGIEGSPKLSRVATFPANIAKKQTNPAETVFHELGHVAQRVGMGDRFNPTYQAATDVLGYKQNPLEISARSIARRKLLSATNSPFDEAPYSALEQLKALGILK